jgi:hypothetical protein
MLERSKRNHSANLTGKLKDNSVWAETFALLARIPN